MFEILFFLYLLLAGIGGKGIEDHKVVVNDPFFYFCGSESCYDVLELAPSANQTEIKSSYRRLAALYHPDKNNTVEAKARLHVVMKAYEVLTDVGKDSEGNWKLKEKFDHYLSHPRDYYKVSGHHIVRDIPKTDLSLVLSGLFIVVSLIAFAIQVQRYTLAMKHFKYAVLNNLGTRNGGTLQTIQCFQEAAVQFNSSMSLDRKNKVGKMKSVKMSKDPVFERIVDEMLSKTEIEGVVRPTIKEFIPIKLLLLPINLFKRSLFASENEANVDRKQV